MRQVIHIGPDNQEYLLIEPTGRYKYFAVCSQNHLHMSKDGRKPSEFKMDLPSGKWENLGKASEISEEVAKRIVHKIEGEDDEGEYLFYSNYQGGISHEDAAESLLSLCKSHSLNTDNTIILLKL